MSCFQNRIKIRCQEARDEPTWASPRLCMCYRKWFMAKLWEVLQHRDLISIVWASTSPNIIDCGTICFSSWGLTNINQKVGFRGAQSYSLNPEATCWSFLLGGQSLIYSELQLIGWGPPPSWRAICFSQSLLISMLISSRNHLHRNIQNTVPPNIWAQGPCQGDAKHEASQGLIRCHITPDGVA